MRLLLQPVEITKVVYREGEAEVGFPIVRVCFSALRFPHEVQVFTIRLHVEKCSILREN